MKTAKSSADQDPRWTPKQTSRRGFTRVDHRDLDNIFGPGRCPNPHGALALWVALNRACFEAHGQESGRVRIELRYLATKAGLRYRATWGLLRDLIAAGLVDDPGEATGGAHTYQLRGARYAPKNPGKKLQTHPCKNRHTPLCTRRHPSFADSQIIKKKKEGRPAKGADRTPLSSEGKDTESARVDAREIGAAGVAAPIPRPADADEDWRAVYLAGREAQ